MTGVNPLDTGVGGNKHDGEDLKDQDYSPGWPTWEVLGLTKVS